MNMKKYLLVVGVLFSLVCVASVSAATTWIGSFTASNNNPAVGEWISLTAQIESPSGSTISCSIYFGDEGLAARAKTATGALASWTSNQCSKSHAYSRAGTYYASVYVDNPNDNEPGDNQQITINVKERGTPRVKLLVLPTLSIDTVCPMGQVTCPIDPSYQHVIGSFLVSVYAEGGDVDVQSFTSQIKDEVTGLVQGSRTSVSDGFVGAGTSKTMNLKFDYGLVSRLIWGNYAAHLAGVFTDSGYHLLGDSLPGSYTLLITGEKSPFLHGGRFTSGVLPLAYSAAEIFAERASSVMTAWAQPVCDSKGCPARVQIPIYPSNDKIFKVDLSSVINNLHSISIQDNSQKGSPESNKLYKAQIVSAPTIKNLVASPKGSFNPVYINWEDSVYQNQRYDIALIKNGAVVTPTEWPYGGFGWGCNGKLSCGYSEKTGAYTRNTEVNVPASTYAEYQVRVCTHGTLLCVKSNTFSIGAAKIVGEDVSVELTSSSNDVVISDGQCDKVVSRMSFKIRNNSTTKSYKPIPELKAYLSSGTGPVYPMSVSVSAKGDDGPIGPGVSTTILVVGSAVTPETGIYTALVDYMRFTASDGTKTPVYEGRWRTPSVNLNCPSGAVVPTFSYDTGKDVKVLSPNGAESMVLGTTHTIKWAAKDGGTKYDLAMIKSGSPVAGVFPGEGYGISPTTSNGEEKTYTWTVPAVSGSDFTIRVCPAGKVPCDQSDSFFSIVRGERGSLDRSSWLGSVVGAFGDLVGAILGFE